MDESKRQRERLKKRLRAYKNLTNNYVFFSDSDFKSIFNKIKQKRNMFLGNTFFEVVDSCKDEDIIQMNKELDYYQTSKIEDEFTMEGIIEEMDTNARTFMLCGTYSKKMGKNIKKYFRKNTVLTVLPKESSKGDKKL